MPKLLATARFPRRHEPAPDRKRWTRRECAFLFDNEILIGRYELIDGELISKMGQKRPHAIVVVLLMKWLSAVFGSDRVQCQLPIDVADADNPINEPEPDGAAFAHPVTDYTDHNPGPTDLLLVIEVSDTTLRFDLRNKASLYARAAIREYWVVDIANRQIIAHRDPTPRGYRQVIAYAADESVSPLASPEAVVRVVDLLPPIRSQEVTVPQR